jgi:cyclase
MLRSRITPCLLIQNKGLVKTVEFKSPKYVGDPLNAVKIFNEKEVDELMVLDIDATVKGKGPDFELIKNLAVECRMPFCYGGGVTTVEQARKIIQLGAEKVALSSAAVENIYLLEEIGHAVGKQSVVVVVDAKKKGFLGDYYVFTHNGTKPTGLKVIDFVRNIEKIGVGEIVINSIDRDGTMKGYDINLIDLIRNNVNVPITVLGGAGDYMDISSIIARYKVIGVAAGSIFVFKGKYKAVLISYPNLKEKAEINNIKE